MNIPNSLKIALSGIRGLAPEVLTSELTYAFVSGFVHLMPEGPIVVGRDSRPSGEVLREAVIAALCDAGRVVLDAGIAPLPTTQVAILEADAAGGINITASHNLGEFNGLKLLGSDSLFIDQVVLDRIIVYVESCITKESSCDGEVEDIRTKAVRWHIERLKPYVIEGAPFTVAVDAVNGAGSYIVSAFLKEIGCEVIELATDPRKPFPHTPEPTPENLAWTQKQLAGLEYNLCVVVDPDADRLALIDESGELLSEEVTLPLVFTELLLEGRVGSAVTNLSTSRLIDDVAAQYGVEVHRSSIGERNVIDRMKEVDAVFGGEGNGGVIDPKIHFGRDSLVGILYVINYLRRTGSALSEVGQKFETYVMKKDKVNVSSGSTLQVYEESLKEVFSTATLDTQDGLHFSWSDKWVHIRFSNTESVLRIIGEAVTEEKINDLFEEVSRVLQNRA